MAIDQRRRNANWTVSTEKNTYHDPQFYAYASLAVLMDIREELQRLNQLLHCSNFVGIPHTLKRIDRRLATTRKLTKGKR